MTETFAMTMNTETAPSAVDELIALLDLEAIEVNIFRGVSPEDRSQRVFGGQVLGQALVAASRTVEGRLCHSLHGYFLLPGDPKVPILYQVDRSRDGKSFCTRRVVAIQHGRQIFHMSASFAALEHDQFEHQIDPPNGPRPHDLASEDERRQAMLEKVPEQYREHFARKRPIEIRPVEWSDMFNPKMRPPNQSVWIRAAEKLPDDVALHQCILAYASDMTLLDTSLLPHGIGWFEERIQMASIDHAMWFHRPFRADEWLLYVQDSPSAASARGFNRGTIYTENGMLVASVAQEGLMRLRRDL